MPKTYLRKAAVIVTAAAALAAGSTAVAQAAPIEIPGVGPVDVDQALGSANGLIADFGGIDAILGMVQGVDLGSLSTLLPAPGEPGGGTNPGQTQAVYLKDLKAASGVSLGKGPKRLGGVLFAESVYNSFTNESVRSFEYDLGKGYQQFLATIGVADDSANSSGEFQFSVQVDNRAAQTFTVKFGEPKAIAIDVRDGLRLKLKVTRTGPTNATAVWGNARLTK